MGAPVGATEPSAHPAFAAESEIAVASTTRSDPTLWARDGSQRRARVAVSPRLLTWVGDTCAAILLSQIIYWSRRGASAGREGWIHKTAAQWLEETGLSPKQQARSRRLLLDKRLIEERLCGMPAHLEFRLHLPVVVASLQAVAMVYLGPTDCQSGSADGTAPPLVSWSTPAYLDDVLGRLLGRSFLFEASLTRYMSVTAAMLVSRLRVGMGQVSRAIPADGPPADLFGNGVRMQRQEWRAETGLTRHQWETARRDLRTMGLVRERHHNYPRRVVIALNLTAYAALLKQDAPALRARAGKPAVAVTAAEPHSAASVWVKQPSHLVGSPPQAAVLPKPTASVAPEPPTTPPQTGLQLKRELQGNYLPPPPSARELTPLPDRQGVGDLTKVPSLTRSPGRLVTFAWSAPLELVSVSWRPTLPLPLSNSTKAAQVRQEAAAPQEANDTANTTQEAPVALAWPPCFEPADRAACLRFLASVEVPMQQTILDEIDWVHRQGKVRSPVGLVRVLCLKALTGEFVAEGAHRVAGERQRRAKPAQACQPHRPPHTTQPRQEFGGPSEQSKARLAQIKAEMQARRLET